MAGKKNAQPCLESIARGNRQRLAVEEGARAMADINRRLRFARIWNAFAP
jgi:hypothetical protein